MKNNQKKLKKNQRKKMHLKRQKVPKNWPIKRKGTKYVVRPSSNMNKGLPILIILRDVLGLGQNRREIKRALNSGSIMINNKIIKDEKENVLLFDTITIIPSKQNYKLELTEKGKFRLGEIDEKDAGKKIAKITNKKTLKGKKAQVNLSDGRNFLSDIKCNVGDSVIINFKDKKIEKCLPLKEKAKIIVFEGKHAGEEGVIKQIIPEKKISEVLIGEKDISILIKQLMVVE